MAEKAPTAVAANGLSRRSSRGAAHGRRAIQQGRRQGALLWAGTALILLVAAPFSSFFVTAMPSCPFKSWTGVPCPTCGTTRAAALLAELRPLEALVLYPLATVAWVLFIAGGLLVGAWAGSGRPLPGLPRRISRGTQALVLSLILLNWLYSWLTGV